MTVVTEEKPKPNTFIVQGVILRGMPVDRMYNVESSEDREEWINAIRGVVDGLKVRTGKKGSGIGLGEGSIIDDRENYKVCHSRDGGGPKARDSGG